MKQVINKIPFYITFFILCFLPLIVRLHIHKRLKGTYEYIAYPISRGDYDFFHYYKGIILIICSLILLGIVVYKPLLEFKRFFVYIYLIGFLMILSSVFESYGGYSLMGGAESFQGVFVWLSYLFMCVVSTQFYEKNQLKYLLLAFLLGGIISSLFGLYHYFYKYPIYDLEFLINHSNFKFNRDGRTPRTIVSIFYNSNFYAIYLLMVTLVNLMLVFIFKSIRMSFLFYISFAIILFNLFGAKSEAASYIYLLMFIIVIGFLVFKKTFNDIKKIIPMAILTFGVVLFFRSDLFFSYSRHVEEVENQSTLKEIISHQDEIHFIPFEGKPLYAKLKDSLNINFFADKYFDTILNLRLHKTNISFEEIGYHKYKFEVDKNKKNRVKLWVNYDSLRFPLAIDNNQFKTIDYNGRIAEIKSAPKIDFFHRHYKMISRRGMIWAQTLPLLKDKWIIGSGADTFPLEYPGYDYLSRWKAFKSLKRSHATMAHSFYLDFALSFGNIALLIFLVWMLSYIYQTIKLLLKSNLKSFLSHFSLTCLLVIVSFLLCSITNSGFQETTTFCFVFLGLGASSNIALKTELRQQKDKIG